MDRKPIEKEKEGGRYKLSAPSSKKFFSSGSTLLDCALGGGWLLGKMGNIVGDSSTGKTLLCIEACANFARTFKNSPVIYRESEAAFDIEYAEKLGLPVGRIELNPNGMMNTVEEVFNEMQLFFEKALESKEGGLYILDSLDALSDQKEMDREFGEGTYGTKPKLLGELFRRVVRPMEESNSTCIIVSQTRQNIGVSFGQKWRVAGGDGIKFYPSQRIILSAKDKITKTIQGVEREVGVNIRARVFKNKVCDPNREADFPIRYRYGVDDVTSIVDWFEQIKKLPEIGIETAKDAAIPYIKALNKLTFDEQDQKIASIVQKAKDLWAEIEDKLSPERQKYS